MLRLPAIAIPILTAAALLVADASAAAAQVSAFPSPGSHFARPRTQITFRGVGPSGLGSVKITGSKTGAHSGQIEGDSDNDGASFIPAQPFAPGETVTVNTSLSLLGSSNGSYTFTVANPAGGITPPPRPAGGGRPTGFQSFHSRPDLRPAAVRVVHNSTSTSPGDIFVAPQFGPVQVGPMILDPGGNLIWWNPMPPGSSATDFRVQSYGGQPVLTWWQGYVNHGLGVGKDVIFDSTYRQIATVQAGNGLSADLHEFQLTPRGTALIIAQSPVYLDLSKIHGARHASVIDTVIQEIDIKTGLVLFEWHSLDHVSVTDSHTPPPKVNGHIYDFFHGNSAGLDRDGNLIISARNTWAAYKVDHNTGAVIWRLGGRHSSFKMKGGTTFAWQHDVRVQGDGSITLFDDGAGPAVHTQSRALRLHLSFSPAVASWMSQDEHSPKLLAGFEGNQQLLPNGDSFVGWGQQPYFTEFNRKGQTVFDARFVFSTPSYRAYRLGWSAQPAAPPNLAVSRSGSSSTVYASWNGATAVASWRVLAGSSPTALQTVGSSTRRGFETATRVSSAGPYFAVQALSASGQVLGTSTTIKSS